MLGLHFWVEVRAEGSAGYPIDPTFDQVPASALRIKLGDTDLADLGSVGWEGAALAFSGVRWVPEQEETRPWGESLILRGDQITGPEASSYAFQVEDVSEGEAYELLDQLMALTGSS